MASDMGSPDAASDQRPGTGAEREREMYRLRTVEGLTLGDIAARFGVGAERVRQLINRHVRRATGQIPNPGQLSRIASQIRRQAELARAQEHAVELLVGWREGADVQQLARELGLRVGCVRQTIQELAGEDDCMARSAALREPVRSPRW